MVAFRVVLLWLAPGGPIKGFALFIVAILSACADADFPGPEPVTAAPPVRVSRNVDIAARAYSPVPVTVTVGTRVFWTNKDVEPHTVTFQPPVSHDSGWLAPNGETTRQFNLIGTFSYYCRIHEGMRGTVHVIARDFVPTL